MNGLETVHHAGRVLAAFQTEAISNDKSIDQRPMKSTAVQPKPNSRQGEMIWTKKKEKKPVDNRQTRTTPVRCMAASVCKWAETRWLLMGQHALERGKLGNMLIFMDGIASQGVWGSISLLLTHSIAFLFFSPRPGHDVPTTRHYPHFRAWRPTTCSRKKNELRPATLMHEKKFGANSFSFSLKLLRWPCPRRNKTRRLSPTQKRTTYRSIYRVSLSVSHSESDKTWMISCIGMLHCRKKTFHVWSVFPLFSLSLSKGRKEERLRARAAQHNWCLYLTTGSHPYNPIPVELRPIQSAGCCPSSPFHRLPSTPPGSVSLLDEKQFRSDTHIGFYYNARSALNQKQPYPVCRHINGLVSFSGPLIPLLYSPSVITQWPKLWPQFCGLANWPREKKGNEIKTQRVDKVDN